jgi:IS30 family transposase
MLCTANSYTKCNKASRRRGDLEVSVIHPNHYERKNYMQYRQITSGERYTLSALKREGLNQSEIAQRLGRHRSSVSRELRRNSTPYDGGYRPELASIMARARRWKSRTGSQFSERDLRQVERKLQKQWSPEQISGRFYLTGQLSISHETIYGYVLQDRKEGGHLYKELRHSRKKRRKSHNSLDNRGRLPGKRHISERPNYVERRSSPGHWEGDTVVGGGTKDCALTLVERKSGYTMIGKLEDRSSKTTSRRLIQLIRRHPEKFKTITLDNGTEFHDYKSVEEATGVKFYFATPYHSWERGSNENLNGLARQYLPKRTSMAHLTQRGCDVIAKNLNTRPRKRLGFWTPEEDLFGA